jgi:exodeoxyribonuclease VII large subunit
MADKTYTVSELTRLIKNALENNPLFSGIWIKGELSNITYHSSGHIYCTLKDESAVIAGVFFKYANRNLSFRLEEGMSVLAFGSLSLFEKRGSYQFIISQLRLEGVGELLKKIEQLKKKLLGEGVFDPVRKRPLPFLPKRLGVVTSPTGAAVRDIIKVALRRYPNLEILLAPAVVQGADAAVSIVKAIEEINRSEWGVDVIICGRGGGSFEDLMPFNEEMVVRAFYHSRVPIVSAVGHQIDHPLSDDAADSFAPTPSAAAEIVVPLKKELSDEIGYLLSRSYTYLASRVREHLLRVSALMARRTLRTPMEIINTRQMALNDLENRMLIAMKDRIGEAKGRFYCIPDTARSMSSIVNARRSRFLLAMEAVKKLSPEGILRRGYCIAKDDAGAIIKGISEIDQGDTMKLVLHDGSLGCTVNSKIKEVHIGKKSGTKKTQL